MAEAPLSYHDVCSCLAPDYQQAFRRPPRLQGVHRPSCKQPSRQPALVRERTLTSHRTNSTEASTRGQHTRPKMDELGALFHATLPLIWHGIGSRRARLHPRHVRGKAEFETLSVAGHVFPSADSPPVGCSTCSQLRTLFARDPLASRESVKQQLSRGNVAGMAGNKQREEVKSTRGIGALPRITVLGALAPGQPEIHDFTQAAQGSAT